METFTFIINDNSVNRYGFRVLSEGIELDNYQKNPVVKVMHDRYEKWMPIGIAHNLRLNDNGELLADIEFDEDDKLAVKIMKKVKKKMLNAVSVGLDDREWSEDPELMLKGQTAPTLTKSELMEISIVDVPGNGNAVRLYSKGSAVELSADSAPATIKKLSNKDANISNQNSNKMFKLFTQILAIQLDGAPVVDLSIDEPKEADVKKGIQLLSDKITELSGQVVAAEAAKSKAEEDLQSFQEQAESDKADNLVDTALSLGKITSKQKDAYVKLAKSDYESTKAILDEMKGRDPLSGANSPADSNDPLLKLSWDEAHKQDKLVIIQEKFPDHFTQLKADKFGAEA